MDKNVGSVNLDELKAAREALDRERGIETDPNMYNDYDPEKHKAEKEQEKLSREALSNEDMGDVSADKKQEESNENAEQISNEPVEDLDSTQQFGSSFLDAFEVSNNNDSDKATNLNVESVENERSAEELEESVASANETNVEDDYARSPEAESKIEDKEETSTNFDIYDNFADFEVNSETKKSSHVENNLEEMLAAEEAESQTEVEDDEENSSLDSFLSDLDSILSKEESDDDKISEDVIEDSSNGNDSSLEDMLDLETENKESVEEKTETNLPKNSLEKFAVDESTISYSDDEIINNASQKTEVLTDFSKLSEMAEEIENENSVEEKTELKEESDEVDSETEDSKDSENEEESEVGGYTKIEEFNFVDVMSSEEFKDEDKLSYVLGKDDSGDVVYCNLRDTCGTAVFSRDEDAVFDQFSSILLSLLLKNTPQEIQFVVCDAMYDSEFDVFNDSSYMYFNRVAKNNREIVDSLIELSKELETRYNNLVYAGVKSISAYNLQAEERGSAKMPYIVLFMNNYAKMTQFLDTDRINVCLHNILKFGRIAGIYAVIASASEIERNDINFNLPTRICYKAEDAHESVAMLGREGAEELKSEKDFLYSTVYDEEIRHLKVPSLTQKEIELIIENLEN